MALQSSVRGKTVRPQALPVELSARVGVSARVIPTGEWLSFLLLG